MKKFGLSAFDDHQEQRYSDVSNEILKRQSVELDQQLSIFRDRLIKFAKKHNKEIKENSEFRSKFMHMCSSIGIDPLSLFDKDRHIFNAEDFYYEICVKIIEICRQTRDMNGGVISLNELLNGYFANLNLERADLEKAIEMLTALDGGIELLQIRGKKFLRSVPNELTSDQTKILEVCSVLGYASMPLLRANLEWKHVRSKATLDEMVSNGLLWIDTQGSGKETLYWDPSWIMNLQGK